MDLQGLVGPVGEAGSDMANRLSLWDVARPSAVCTGSSSLHMLAVLRADQMWKELVSIP